MPDDPPLPADLVLSPGTGSLVFAGNVSDILPLPLIPRDAINPGTGALTFAGNVSSVLITSPLILSPTSGALTFAGHVSDILVNSVGVGPTVSPGTGALTLTGNAPTVSVSGYPRFSSTDIGSGLSLSNGDLTVTHSASTNRIVRVNSPQRTGKFYFRVAMPTIGSTGGIGVANILADLTNYLGFTNGAAFSKGGASGYVSDPGPTFSGGYPVQGNTHTVAVDIDNRRIWMKGGTSTDWNADATANPSTNTGGMTIPAWASHGNELFPAVHLWGNGSTATIDFTTITGDSTLSGFTAWPSQDQAAKRFWRISTTTSQGGGANTVSFNEIEMRLTSGGADQTAATPTGRASASSTFTAWDAYKAVDNSTANNGWSSNGAPPAWWQYDFEADKNITELAITIRADTTIQAPSNFTILYSANMQDWTTAKTVTSQSWSAGETKTYSIP